jgi:hypothetical protein
VLKLRWTKLGEVLIIYIRDLDLEKLELEEESTQLYTKDMKDGIRSS